MRLDEFVNKYNGKKVDYDKVYGPQCVDLFRQYCEECLNIPEHTGSCSTSGGAKDLFLDYNKMPVEKKYFKRIFYSQTFKYMDSFKSGDVLVWDSNPNNKYGHVAICLGVLDDSLIVFEQNGVVQDGAKINIKTKKNLLGLLRKNER